MFLSSCYVELPINFSPFDSPSHVLSLAQVLQQAVVAPEKRCLKIGKFSEMRKILSY